VDIFLLVLHVFLSLGIITLVLLQKGAGASAGASFGGGAGSGSVFGATGSANFLSKTTAFFAIGFFVNSLVLAYLASHREVQTDSVLDVLTAPAVEVQRELSGEIPEPELNIPAADPSESPAAGNAEQTEDEVPAPAGE